MELQSMLKEKIGWLAEGPSSEIVVSSRIRLARNLAGIPFPQRASREAKNEVFSKIRDVCQKSKYLKNAKIINLEKSDKVDRQFLMERHLISYEHAIDSGNKGVIVGDMELISIMVNEEDHLRIQGMQPGLQLNQIYGFLEGIDEGLSKKLNYAFSDRVGYLTACPTNTGTGMRASLLMHLPALVISKEINRVIQALSKVGIVARGLYGEGTKVMGDLFQISNQVTLGNTEKGIVDNLVRVAKQVVEYEIKERKSIFKNEREKSEDLIYRAYGILSNAHRMSFSEAMEHFSKVRLGIYMGLHVNVGLETINELMIFTQPAHLQESEGKELTISQRDIMRAKMIREKLKNNADLRG